MHFSGKASDTASHYDFHFFDNETKGLQYTYDIDADTACSNSVCSVELTVDLPVFNSHAWRVRAGNVIGDSAWTRSLFDVVDPPPIPATPVNLTPAQNANIEAGETIAFVWQSQPQIDTYDFHLFDRTDGSLTSVNALPASDYCNESHCSIEMQVDLPVNDNHAWRSRARNQSGLSAWSRTEFNVITPITEAPDAPVLSSPSASAAFFPDDATAFAWLPSEQTSQYEFAFVNTTTGDVINPATIDPTANCTATECEHTAQVPEEVADHYLWQVRSVNAIGASAWVSLPFEVIERVTEAPPVPVNVTPDVGIELVQGSSVTFSWLASETASHYDFHFFDNQSKALQYTRDLDSGTVCTDGLCSLELTVDLPLFTDHAWRVRAANVIGNSAWTRSLFDVIEASDLIPDVPVNVSPAASAVLFASTIQSFRVATCNWSTLV